MFAFSDNCDESLSSEVRKRSASLPPPSIVDVENVSFLCYTVEKLSSYLSEYLVPSVYFGILAV